jgi:hypothetical protein
MLGCNCLYYCSLWLLPVAVVVLLAIQSQLLLLLLLLSLVVLVVLVVHFCSTASCCFSDNSTAAMPTAAAATAMQQDDEDVTALQEAVRGSFLEAATALVEAGADPNQAYADDAGNTQNMLYDIVSAVRWCSPLLASVPCALLLLLLAKYVHTHGISTTLCNMLSLHTVVHNVALCSQRVGCGDVHYACYCCCETSLW